MKKKQKSGPDEGSHKKRPKKKKDPHAPKRAIAPFMYFSKAERAVSYLNPKFCNARNIQKTKYNYLEKLSTVTFLSEHKGHGISLSLGYSFCYLLYSSSYVCKHILGCYKEYVLYSLDEALN